MLTMIFSDQLLNDVLPNRTEIERAMIDHPSLPNLHYRSYIFKLHNMRQTIRRRKRKKDMEKT